MMMQEKRFLEEFKEMIRTETVVGQPIYLDDATIVPFVDIYFRFRYGKSRDKRRIQRRSRRRQNEPYGGSDYERRTRRIILH